MLTVHPSTMGITCGAMTGKFAVWGEVVTWKTTRNPAVGLCTRAVEELSPSTLAAQLHLGRSFESQVDLVIVRNPTDNRPFSLPCPLPASVDVVTCFHVVIDAMICITAEPITGLNDVKMGSACIAPSIKPCSADTITCLAMLPVSLRMLATWCKSRTK
jgi:hypothetical protein